MINKTSIAAFEFERPRRNFILPDYIGEVEMITPNQKETLTALIFQKIQDKNEREWRVSELDDLTSKDAALAIFQFEMANW